jgi:hypothetical protein
MTNLGIGHNGGPPLEELEVVRVRVLPDGRLGRKNAALYLRRSPKTLAQWALHGKARHRTISAAGPSTTSRSATPS